MKTITNDSGFAFDVVDEFPNGYEIWAIGREYFDFEGYIPLCEVGKDYSVNTDTLKALKVKDETLALALMDEAIKKGVNKNKYNKMIKA